MESINDSRKLMYAILCTYFEFGINHQEHYRLMFRKQWDKELYPDLYHSAFEIFKLVENCLEKAENIRKSPTESTAIMYAFIHGLVELNSASIRNRKGTGSANPSSRFFSRSDFYMESKHRV